MAYKQVIGGILYDTEQAEEIADYWNGLGQNDFNNLSETLYKTEKGNWFIYGEGGAFTKYAIPCNGNMTTGSDAIIPMSDQEAQEFLEEHSDPETYQTYFETILA